MQKKETRTTIKAFQTISGITRTACSPSVQESVQEPSSTMLFSAKSASARPPWQDALNREQMREHLLEAAAEALSRP